MPPRRIRRPLLALIALLAVLAIGYAVNATRDSSPSASATASSTNRPARAGQSSAIGQIALSSLPAQAAQTVVLIKKGGPFPYPKNDGVVFGNLEHLLPRKSSGYYHEYTVPTPGSKDRGARRIITGKDGEYYYTGDHYEHFQLVDVGA